MLYLKNLHVNCLYTRVVAQNCVKQYVLKQRRICLQGSTSLISSLANSTYELRLLQWTLYPDGIPERSSCERRPQVDHGLIGYLWRRWLGVIVKSWLEILEDLGTLGQWTLYSFSWIPERFIGVSHSAAVQVVSHLLCACAIVIRFGYSGLRPRWERQNHLGRVDWISLRFSQVNQDISCVLYFCYASLYCLCLCIISEPASNSDELPHCKSELLVVAQSLSTQNLKDY